MMMAVLRVFISVALILGTANAASVSFNLNSMKAFVFIRFTVNYARLWGFKEFISIPIKNMKNQTFLSYADIKI